MLRFLQGRDGREAESPKAAVQEISSAISQTAPTVEAQLVLPAIEKGKAGLLVVYRDTRFDFADSNGFDTLIFRFSLSPNGWLDGASVYERRIDGERARANYNFSYAGDGVAIAQTVEGNSREIADVTAASGKIEVRGTTERIVAREPGGGISFASISGDYQERFIVPGYRTEGAKCSFPEMGLSRPKGVLIFPKKAGYSLRNESVGIRTGSGGTIISLWIDWIMGIIGSGRGCRACQRSLCYPDSRKALSGDQRLADIMASRILSWGETGLRGDPRPMLSLGAGAAQPFVELQGASSMTPRNSANTSQSVSSVGRGAVKAMGLWVRGWFQFDLPA